jgi:hypothetical protein
MNNNTNDEWLNLTTFTANNDTIFVIVNNATATLNNTTDTQDPMSTALWCLGMMGLWLFASTRSQIPSREHWRGSEIREGAQRIWRLQEELRVSLVLANLRTKRILAQDSQGNWTLGNLTSGDSPQKTKAFPLVEDDDDEEAQACVICLDPFQVGDVVSWSRYSETCHHVFHSECIQPWLQDKRRDECPSCRANLMIKDNITINSPTQEEEDENDEENPPIIDNCHEEEESEEEEDSLFVIMHGLVSRAARRASYTWIGIPDKCDSMDHNHNSTEEKTTSFSVPSPLRRVVSHGTTRDHHRQYPPAAPLSLDPQSILSQKIAFRRSLSGPATPTRRSSFQPTLRQHSSRIGDQQDPSESSMEDGDLGWLVPPQVMDRTLQHPAGRHSSINRLSDPHPVDN